MNIPKMEAAISTKCCSRCKKVKSVDNFSKDAVKSDGLCGQCRNCRRIYQQSERGKVRAKRYKQSEQGKRKQKKAVLKKYGLTPENYDQMLTDQRGRCAICGGHWSEFQRGLAVDHNKETGIVRELLCGGCNMGIGQLKHDTELLESAIAYLWKHQND